MEKTPLQKTIEGLRDLKVITPTSRGEAYNDGIDNSIEFIELMLPAEEVFAKDAFNAGMKRQYMLSPSILDKEINEPVPHFDDYYSKYKQ